MSNPTQKLRNPQVGQRVTAAREESVISMIKRLIVGGEGITTRMIGDQVVIEAKRGVGAAFTPPDPFANAYVKGHRATTFEGLPDPETVASIDIARVTEGDDQGMMCYVSPDGESWWSWTHFQ